jgi:hypothetical protein
VSSLDLCCGRASAYSKPRKDDITFRDTTDLSGGESMTDAMMKPITAYFSGIPDPEEGNKPEISVARSDYDNDIGGNVVCPRMGGHRALRESEKRMAGKFLKTCLESLK